jgi:dipeptide/tripeptide permease
MEGSSRRRFPATFWVANTMEIFERMAWYGFFSVSSLYLTNPRSEGALGFTSEQRGTLQGVVTFILYLLPVLTGALADRYGYKRMFLLAFAILTPSYYLLGQVHTYWTFFFVFLLVALGAAIFKPVVVGTVARVTTSETSALGFGIFYMMVNVGGFVGPIVAGIVRKKLSWDWVFIMSAIWIAFNFIWVSLFYKEPTTEATSEKKRTLGEVLRDMSQVLGNWRMFLGVMTIFVLLVCGTNGWLSWTAVGRWLILWIALNLVWDLVVRFGGLTGRSFLAQPIRIGEWRFALFLLVLSGFWTCFNQIFFTMPEYIRDFVKTQDILETLDGWAGGLAKWNWGWWRAIAAAVVWSALAIGLGRRWRGTKKATLAGFLGAIGAIGWILTGVLVHARPFFAQALAEGWKVNPEYIINIDAGAIIVFQVMVSYLMQRFPPFTTMVVGTLIAGLGVALAGWAVTGWFVVLTILIFAFGEMAASPKSQEYIGRVAPPDKVALYMGYYFVAIALGNLFGGLLSGWAYGTIAKGMGRPDLMWWGFGLLGLLTAIALVLFDRLVVPGWRREVAEARAAG